MSRNRKLISTILLLLGVAVSGYVAFTITEQQLSVLGTNIVDTPPTLDLQEASAQVFPQFATATRFPTVTRTASPSATALRRETLKPSSVTPFTTNAPTRIPPTATHISSQTPLPIPDRDGAAVGSSPRAARIAIPTLGVDAVVVEMGWQEVMLNGQLVTDWVVPLNEVGWSLSSVNPGERGNVVMAGHNNLGTAVFKKLYTLKKGDEIRVTNITGATFLYRVALSYVVAERDAPMEKRLENARVMLPTEDARLTLISCWPEWSNSHRAIVIARFVGKTPSREIPTKFATQEAFQ